MNQVTGPLAHAARTAARPEPIPWLTLLIVGLGGLFAGVTGPLLSTFVPILVRDALGEHRAAIGAVMAIDNVLLLLLVPWAGVVSDRAAHRGGSRLPLVLAGFVLAAAGMALFPESPRLGVGGLIAAIVVLYTGINVQRSPFQALIADLVPSRVRSLATGSVTFQMCVGAIVFLMLGRALGMRPAFLIAAAAVLGIAAAFAADLATDKSGDATDGHGRTQTGEGSASQAGTSATEATFRSLLDAAVTTARGDVPGLRSIFLAALMLQVIFQTFSTWFALHGTERFGVAPEDVTIGFIAWAMGGVIGALPAGMIGVRLGRRPAMLLGFAVMGGCFLALDRVGQVGKAIPLLALASAGWTLPMVNAYPLFIEQIPRPRRGVLAALFLLSMALGGAIGDPVNGATFDLAGGYRPMFLMMTVYAALAFAIVVSIPRGAGEADTGPD